MKNYNRKDTDKRKYLVPSDMLAEFDRYMVEIRDFDQNRTMYEYDTLHEQMFKKFQKYMVN